MAQRLSCDERAWIEAMRAAGVSVEETARRLGRHRSTVYRELDRDSRHGRYGAQVAQAAAQARAVRPKTPKLAADRGLAAAVAQRLSMGWSPHAVCADLRVEGRAVCAETIYAACYDHSGSRGLPEGSWWCLPRRCRKRKQRGRHARKPSPLGDFRPIAQRSAAVEDRSEAGHWEGDLIIGANNRSAVATLVERFSRQTLAVSRPDGYDAQVHRRRGVGCAAPPTPPSGQDTHLGPRTRDGPLARHRSRHRRRSLFLRAALAVAAPHQRTNQRPATPLTAQRHQPQHRPSTPRTDPRLDQHDTPQTPRLELSTQRLH